MADRDPPPHLPEETYNPLPGMCRLVTAIAAFYSRMLGTLGLVTSDSILRVGEAVVCDWMGSAEMVLVVMPGILAARVTLCPNDITAPFEGQGAEFPPFRTGIQKKD